MTAATGFDPESSVALTRVPLVEANKLNHFIYCHHCQAMREMLLLGRNQADFVVFRCPCGGTVHIEPAG